VADNNNGVGTGTLVLSFVTGLAAGVAVALLVNAQRTEKKSGDEQEEHLFI